MKSMFQFSLASIALILLAACAVPAPIPTPVPTVPATQAPVAVPTGTRELSRRETRQAESSPTRAPATAPTIAASPTTVPTAPALPAATGPGAIQLSFFAMNTVNPADYPKVPFGTLGHPGVGVWAWVERQKGVYDFNLLDEYVKDAVDHGLADSTNTVSMAITLGYSPQWYASNASSCNLEKKLGVTQCTSAPANVQDWANYVTAMVKHYNGVTAPHIRYYEVWNEVNVPVFYTGTPAEMLALAKAAYPIVHTDPHSMLLTPSVVGPVGNVSRASGATWMAGYLDLGGAQYADGGAFHGYIASGEVKPFPMPEQDSTSGCKEFVGCYGSILTKANAMRQVFDQHGMAGKPMFDTEGGWGNGNLTDPDIQAEWISRWYLLQAGLHASDNLQTVEWFTWGGNASFLWGVIETDAHQPSEAGIAYTQVYNWLVGAAIDRPCSSAADETWTCTITRPGGYRALAVWNVQGSKPYAPAAGFVDYRDLAGNTVKITQGSPVTIGAKPILLETMPLAQASP